MALVKMGLFCKGFVTSYHLLTLASGLSDGGSIPPASTIRLAAIPLLAHGRPKPSIRMVSRASKGASRGAVTSSRFRLAFKTLAPFGSDPEADLRVEDMAGHRYSRTNLVCESNGVPSERPEGAVEGLAGFDSRRLLPLANCTKSYPKLNSLSNEPRADPLLGRGCGAI
jgi:hypothetical protein